VNPAVISFEKDQYNMTYNICVCCFDTSSSKC